MKINKMLTKVNLTHATFKKNLYIVIHYVGAVSSAKNNCEYFQRYQGASANYFVDDNEVWQCIPDNLIAWHCGGGLQGSVGHKYYKKCLNSNSIGIEMCCKKDSKGNLYIGEKTLKNTAELVQMLMKKYGIDASHVIRHYDVTGKLCPKMYVDDKKWSKIHDLLVGKDKATAAKKKDTAVKNSADSGKYFKKYSGKSGSIVDALISVSDCWTFDYRKKIAKANGINNYSGTAAQNTKMLNLLKNGKLLKP